jgi:hypothetical protein
MIVRMVSRGYASAALELLGEQPRDVDFPAADTPEITNSVTSPIL